MRGSQKIPREVRDPELNLVVDRTKVTYVMLIPNNEIGANRTATKVVIH